jgi:trehalose 6-phosphate phosphatase
VVIDTIDFRRSAVLLDVDGTLLDLADTPQGVAVPQRLKRALMALGLQSGGATSFVSGRSMADLDRLFAPLRLAAVAGHGAELRAQAGAVLQRYEAAIPADLRRQLEEFGATHEGIIVEDKGYSLALHYRLAPDKERIVREAAVKICQSLETPLIELLPGKLVLEIKQSGVTKATAVRELMGHPPFAGRRPVFLGDDVTDLSVFKILPDYDGLSISVGRKVEGVAACFERPADVRHWLERISRNGALAAS